MNRIKYFFSIISFFSILVLLQGCEAISKMSEYEELTRQFVESLISEDFQTSNIMMLNQNVDENIRNEELKDIRKSIIKTYGKDFSFSFSKSQKRYSTIESKNTPEGATEVYIDIDGDKGSGTIKLLFDDKTNKIIEVLEIGKKIRL